MDKYLSDDIETRFFELLDNLKLFDPYKWILERNWLPLAEKKDKLFGPDMVRESILMSRWSVWDAEIEMISMPRKWMAALIKIFKYAIDNGIDRLHGKAQPQKFPTSRTDISRRTKVLVDFYASFGFSVVDSSNGRMVARINDDTISAVNRLMQKELDKLLVK